jgi:LEA14-like dessication related protein
MNCAKRWGLIVLMTAFAGLGGCATLPESLVERPELKLRDVQLVGLGFNAQTFLLSFDISNPNAFPLPVNHIRYAVKLDGQRFASGATSSEVEVPANGATEFAISVDLDLLSTAPGLLSIVREGARRDVPYELEGELGIDIPLAPAVRYGTRGHIRLHSGRY